MISAASAAVLRVDRLGIATDAGRRIVDGVSFDVQPGEIVALVGESGSGKTTVGRAVMGLLAPGLSKVAGVIVFQGRNLGTVTREELRRIRGGGIGAVFQDPMSSLNPSLTVGSQMMEVLRLHEGITGDPARRRCLDMLERVRIRDPRRSFDEYPGRFSGGMRQRFMLASVLLTRPALLVADEPTTALDAVVRREIMEQVVELTRVTGTAVLLVSHDLAMVAQYAERSVVLRNGSVVDQGRSGQVLLQPRVDYTRQLLSSSPQRGPSGGANDAAGRLVEVRDLGISFHAKRRHLFARREAFHAVRGVSFDIRRGEILAVVGESGSGKSTIGKALLALHAPTAGRITFAGKSDETTTADAGLIERPRVQMIFQDAGGSLDPRMTIEQAVAEPLRNTGIGDARTRLRMAREILSEVGLDADKRDRYPHQLSGGQRQRVGIARAIVGGCDLIVADEPVSALDVSIQRQILDLLKRMRDTYGLTYLFISHDLDVVEEIADRVMVMQRGCVVEIGTRDAVFDSPTHPYTRTLLEATPRIRRASSSHYALVASSSHDAVAPAGYAFHLPDRESTTADPRERRMVAVAEGHLVCCDHAAPASSATT